MLSCLPLQSFANIASQSSKVLSNVKGLAAVKVTSLVDAFNKPFLVGGLRRPDDVTGKGKEKAVDPRPNGTGRHGGQEDHEEVEEEEPAGSPDWPDEPDEPDDRPPSPPRGRVPSRSPGLSPEPREVGAGEVGADNEGVSGVWQDPLEDEEDEDKDGPLAKRARTDR